MPELQRGSIQPIFISYSRTDASIAFRLAAELRNAGIVIWLDVFELRPGDDWRAGLESALNSAAACVVLLSPDYAASDYCRKELYRAESLRIPIYPVLIRELEPKQWPIPVQGTQYVSILSSTDDVQFRTAFDSLLAAIRLLSPRQVQTPPGPETQYLVSLIAQLESKRGVLEYLDLQASSDYRMPARDDEWGFAQLENADEPGGGSSTGVRQAAADIRRFVLTGEPGAGKTTTLRRLALDAARDCLEGDRLVPLPVVLSLPEWHDGQTLEQFIRQGWPIGTDIMVELQEGRALVYLDGLNEMGAGAKQKIEALREWLQSATGPQRLVVTCRRSDYNNSNLRLGSLPVVALQALDEAGVQRFSAKYLGEKAPAFLAQITSGSDAARFSRLSTNPYLLSALIYLFEHSSGEAVPRNAGALIRGLARALWRRERQRGTPGWEPYETVEPRLSKLAYSMIDSGTTTSVTFLFALEHLGTRETVEALTSANLLSADAGQVSFYHQWMQEFFAANELMSMDLDSVLPRPEFSRRHLDRRSGKWDQVVTALLGVHAENASLIRQIGRIDPYYLGLWGQSVDQIAPHIHDLILTIVSEQLRDDDWQVRVAALLALGLIGGEESAGLAAHCLNDSYSREDGGGMVWKIIYPVRTAAAWTLGRIGHPSSVKALIQAVREPENNWDIPYWGNRNATGDALRALRIIATPEARREVSNWIQDGRHPYLFPQRLSDFSFAYLGHERDMKLYRDLLRELLSETGVERPHKDIDDFPRNYVAPGAAMYIFSELLRPIGLAALSETVNGLWTLDYFYIRPAFRRFGMGRALLKVVVDELKANGTRAAQVALQKDWSGALAFFQDSGFKQIAAADTRIRLERQF